MVDKAENKKKKSKEKKKTQTKKQVKTQTKKQPKKQEKVQSEKEEKPQPKIEDVSKPKSRNVQLIASVIVIVCIIAVVWFLLSPGVQAKAQLVVESGIVEVKHQGGSWVTAENGMDLVQSDSIRTGDNTSASIILFKTSVVRLDSNTEVTLEQLIREEETSVILQQDSGRTWNTISKISGIDNYEVQTPTTVASIRGTAFVVVVYDNDSTYYGVEHGILNVSSVSGGVIIDSIDVSGNESVFVFIDLIEEELEIVPFEMVDEWILENLLKDQDFVDDLKAELYARIEEYVPELMEYGMTVEDIDYLLEGYVLGILELPEDAPEWVKELFEFS